MTQTKLGEWISARLIFPSCIILPNLVHFLEPLNSLNASTVPMYIQLLIQRQNFI